jgi:hypothetical protein
MERIHINTDEADKFGVTDRELIKTLYKKVILLEERIGELEVDTEACAEWIRRRDNK